MKIRMTPVYAPENIGGLLLGPIGWEADIELPQAAEPKPLLSVAEAAKVLGVGRTTVNAMTLDGTIPFVRVRGRKRIRRDDLEVFKKRGSAARPRRRAA